MSKLLPMPYQAEVTKALALQQGVQLASEMKLFQTIFKLDVLSLACHYKKKENLYISHKK